MEILFIVDKYLLMNNKDFMKTILEKNLFYYQNIAFDLDDTLIGENPYKSLFWYYIKNNKNKKYFIVTFRTKEKAFTMWDEINTESNGIISKNNFFQHDLFINDMILKDIKKIKTWKGETCHKLKCEILIDDLEEYVLEGCKKYNIDFINSLTFTIKKF